MKYYWAVTFSGIKTNVIWAFKSSSVICISLLCYMFSSIFIYIKYNYNNNVICVYLNVFLFSLIFFKESEMTSLKYKKMKLIYLFFIFKVT